jgi:hypothetical protein
LCRLCPKANGLLDETRLCAVTRQQFGLVLGSLGEVVLKGFGDSGVKRTSRFAQQRAVGGALNKSCLKR